MDSKEFRHQGHAIIDWIADYLDHAEQYPVMSACRPGQIAALIPDRPPEQGESLEKIFADFERDLLPGVTHWNHPRFFAYFPANNSGPSILGELLSAGLGVNAMLWQTSPAATELEQKMTDWLRDLIGLPDTFAGVIQDTASTATLVALLCARERASDFMVNAQGGHAAPPLRIYCSGEAHSSVVKGAKIAGFGAAGVVTVGVDAERAMDPGNLDARIEADLAAGLQPCCVVATVGTTSTTAIDPLPRIGPIARRHGLWLHVDAALAGSAAILPQMRWLLAGAEHADSLVFNPHKWLFTNFDCSAFYVQDPAHLQRTLAIDPEYLKTDRDREVVNFRDWGIQLGRRFRALKLWFVQRSFGGERLREMVAAHIELAAEFAGWIDEHPDWERLAPVPLNTVCFRYSPERFRHDQAALNRLNKELMDRVNRGGRIYLTHTALDGRFTLRMAIGQTGTDRRHVLEAWEVLQAESARA